MKVQVLVGIAFAGVVLAAVLVSGLVLPGKTDPEDAPNPNTLGPNSEFDWSPIESRLKAMGEAVQIYRKQNKILPVSQRKSDVDAGLACGVAYLPEVLSQKRKPWSLSASVLGSTITKEGALGGYITNFQCAAEKKLFESDTEPSDAEWAEAWAKRGEEIPIFYDVSMNDWEDARKHHHNRPLILLRLNGKVERVEADITNRKEILLTK